MRDFSFEEFRTNGLLWLINTSVFHPRGFAVGFIYDDEGNLVGWSINGDGTEPWVFADDADNDACFDSVNEFFGKAMVDALVEQAIEANTDE